MAKISEAGDKPLTPTKRELQRALRISAERATRLATAYGLKVPGKTIAAAKPKAAKGVGR